MMNKGKRLLAIINYPRTLPVYLCAVCSKQKNLIEMDIARWNEIDGVNFGFFESLNWYMTYKKEFRNLIQHRLKQIGKIAHFFNALSNVRDLRLKQGVGEKLPYLLRQSLQKARKFRGNGVRIRSSFQGGLRCGHRQQPNAEQGQKEQNRQKPSTRGSIHPESSFLVISRI
mgnify:CR=1 FL=1